MLDTLIQIGKIQSQGKDDWDMKIYYPSERTQLVLLIFNIDEQKIIITPEREFDYQTAKDYKCLDVLPGKNLNALVTVSSEHITQLTKSLVHGEFLSILKDKKNKNCNHLEHSVFGKALKKITEMKALFESYSDSNEDLTSKNNVLAAAIQCTELGIDKPMPLANFEEFEEFAKAKIFKIDKSNNSKKLCYATGKVEEDVRGIELTGRYSLNKMFVTETKNYLSNFSKENAQSNYQVAKQNQTLLDLGSKFILENWRIPIAEVEHVVLPKLQGNNPSWGNILLNNIKNHVDILFNLQPLENINQDLKFTEHLYWLTFLGYDSDGNSLKTVNMIQDINGFYLENLISNFHKTHRFFDELSCCNWESIMTYWFDKELKYSRFNFQTVYKCIPTRKNPQGKKYKNIALSFLKSILEQRKIEKQQLFEHFIELILCHRYKRYNSYANIKAAYSKSPKSTFDNCIKQAVFQYFAIIHVLENLKLFKNNKKEITMENLEKDATAQTSIYNQIDTFFTKMNYNSEQRAMFYLGRILNWVGFAQAAKEHESKPILGRINYNGMDYNAIVRLKKELFLKMKQYHKFSYRDKSYNLFQKCEPLFDLFEKHFELDHSNIKTWKLTREESLFYLLSGYSFRVEKDIDDNN